jgi:hypothetical protein
MVIDFVLVQLFASVTVAVYTPGERPAETEDVELLDQE